ncbi:maleylpyruvate isomerase family mycothiol-dependent enzyme [Nocardioides sp. Kera G14]|uniref:maleylpyruvate isomerase family mycothiol-dependent enzyme n=1 Tax=Nocardioides sp. Kera G14 TaxID=2884264 RepID=UPI001D10DE93|nr:maleylpyruvate isomerase family mycothiol-dependent enzyme [Nocardioides sp. Kera G14]UDY23388.1 maleylpyruvate isomerase family mycothiol-dependent enzyme [Nocardioides sp. Kera G14]
MTRTLEEARAWAELGNELVLKAAAGLTDDDLRAPSTLPGWSVGNLVAHIAANGDALLNLVTWAKTGVETPMYASATDRAEGIAKGDTLSASEATTWLESSIRALAEGFDSLTSEEWSNEVVTAQGRTVPATELPYMRSREGLIHAVDLSTSTARGDIDFSALPEGFLDALIEDICGKRGLSADELPEGTKADVAAWLAGRPHALTDAPEIGAWL